MAIIDQYLIVTQLINLYMYLFNKFRNNCAILYIDLSNSSVISLLNII